MPRIETAIKALTGAIEKEEIPTLEDITEIHRLVAQLVETMIPSDNESSSGEDVSSVEEDSDEEEESPTSCDSESSERRTYKKAHVLKVMHYILRMVELELNGLINLINIRITIMNVILINRLL